MNNEPTVTVGCVSGGWEVSMWRCKIQSANKGLQVAGVPVAVCIVVGGRALLFI
jgi:hypothetical protein